jgi:hypothetical protein
MTGNHDDNGRTEGERRKSEALQTLAARRERYVNDGRRALLRRAIEAGVATADDVRAVVKLPDGINPKLFGSVPGALCRGGLIRRASFTKTARAKAHARPVTIWELIDKDAAEEWLRDHPPPEEKNPTASTVGPSEIEGGLFP